MPMKLSTTVKKIASIPNPTNSSLIREFHQHMVTNGASENHQNNTLKVMITFANFVGPGPTFYDINRKEPIIRFLDSKIKSLEDDPDRKWIITWNDYLGRIKHFMRWLYNQNSKDEQEGSIPQSEWKTPSFIAIKQKKTKRLSPYSETELWERDEILSIVKYEPYKRNKAALTLLWDLDARNHEVTLLKIKHIRLREKYGEGEVPQEAKTGSGPILLTCSFPYVRDWLNEHPFRNEPNARLICNLQNGAPVKSDALWKVMRKIRKRIIRLLNDGCFNDKEEKEKLENLIKTKRWNPYCIRHSAITYDSDYLPEYALKKKVRWSMNSKQEQQIDKKPSILNCPRCSLVNAIENKYCSKCSYPLVLSAFDEIKTAENQRIKAMEEKYEQDMKTMREEMESKFQQILARIDTGKLS